MDTLILDACLTITFGNAGALELVTEIAGYRTVIASRAFGEVLRPPARDALAQAVEIGQIEIESVDLTVSSEQEALARFDARRAFRGRGDAEVLALAVTRGYVVGSDERALRRAVRAELDRSCLMSTLDVIVLAVREGRTSVEQGERLLSSLDIGPFYLLRLEEAGLTLRELAHEP